MYASCLSLPAPMAAAQVHQQWCCWSQGKEVSLLAPCPVGCARRAILQTHSNQAVIACAWIKGPRLH